MLITSNHAPLHQAHFDRVALAWPRRALTVHAPGRRWAGLQQTDSQLLAGLQMLRTLHAQAGAPEPNRLQEALMSGELWALAVLALQMQQVPAWQACVDLAQAMPHLQPALLDAAHWCEAAAVHWAVAHWPAGEDTSKQPVAQPWLCTLFVLQAAQQHAGVLQVLQSGPQWQHLRRGVEHTGPVLEALLQVALHAPWAKVSDLADLAGAVMVRAQQQPDKHLSLLCLSAQVLMRLHRHQGNRASYMQARQLLQALAAHAAQPRWAWQASQALACAEPAQFMAVLDAQAQVPALRAVYLQGLGWSGRSAAMGPLMAAMHEPRWAQLAAASAMLLTGSDPVRDGWEGHAPALPRPADQQGVIRSPDPYLHYPQPDAPAFARWWQAHRSRFNDDALWLEGQALEAPSTAAAGQGVLAQVLYTGRLHAREVAACHLRWRQGDVPRLDTRWPAATQSQWLSTHLPTPIPPAQRSTS